MEREEKWKILILSNNIFNYILFVAGLYKNWNEIISARSHHRWRRLVLGKSSAWALFSCEVTLFNPTSPRLLKNPFLPKAEPLKQEKIDEETHQRGMMREAYLFLPSSFTIEKKFETN